MAEVRRQGRFIRGPSCPKVVFGDEWHRLAGLEIQVFLQRKIDALLKTQSVILGSSARRSEPSTNGNGNGNESGKSNGCGRCLLYTSDAADE